MTEMIEKAVTADWQIALYRKVLQDPLLEKFFALLQELTRTIPEPTQLLASYYEFATAFIPVAADLETTDNSAWHNYICKLILEDENLFSRQAESLEFAAIPWVVKKMAGNDLLLLQRIANISNKEIILLIEQRLNKVADGFFLPEWEGIRGSGTENCSATGLEQTTPVYDIFGKEKDWAQSLESLYAYYRQNGVGIFGQYHAFRWLRNKNGEGSLIGVRNNVKIRLSQLYGYEREQYKVVQNTEQFLAGYPANNVLLYGDRGTGKSSTVKALVNEYGDRGLRLVEVQKQDLEDYPLIIEQLASRPQRFIIYIDDLSFTSDEGEYRALKAMLEGSLEARPSNVLIYATSNRRHLVQESFSDKNITGFHPENEDLHFMDTVQEKLSLADRFGITVTFAAPAQKGYLAIVEKLAQERGLKIEKDELAQQALRWELNNNSRSPRTAKQFIDFLEGNLALTMRNSDRADI